MQVNQFNKLLIILFLLSPKLLASQNPKDIWWSYGLGTSIYTYTREDIPETPTDETKPGGTLSVGLITHRFAFKPKKRIGTWLSLDFKIPFKSIVDGEITVIDAQKGSIQVLSNLGLGLAFRIPERRVLDFYGAVGVHTYLSYLHAYTLYSSPLLEEPSQTEIEQYDAAVGLGGELGIKLNIGKALLLMAGSGFSRDFYSYQDTYVYIEQDPPINYISVGPVPGYTGLHVSPYLTLGYRY